MLTLLLPKNKQSKLTTTIAITTTKEMTLPAEMHAAAVLQVLLLLVGAEVLSVGEFSHSQNESLHLVCCV